MKSEKIYLPNSNTAGICEAGCDEAGRGCLAGPVYAAAVVLADDFHHPWLNDSKQVSESRREALRPIIESEAVAWAVAFVSAAEIDRINILRASILAMHRALDGLCGIDGEGLEARGGRILTPGAVIVDGNKFTPWRSEVPWQTFVKGDGRFGNIAAASILAKTHRDACMTQLAAECPQYGWDVNKGYPTAAHRAAIAAHGPSRHHRMSFRLLPPPTLFDDI